MTTLEKIIKFLERRDYSHLIMILFELTAIIIGLLLVRKQKVGLFFLAYLFFDFSISIFDIYIQASARFSRAKTSDFLSATNSLVALTELIVYYHFFLKIIKNEKTKFLMKYFKIFFTLIVSYGLITKYSFFSPRFFYVSDIVAVIEFLLLLPPCLVYFFELLQTESTLSLHKRPSFWIVTGIFLYSVTSIPYYTIANYVYNTSYNRSLFFLIFFITPFTINFIFLTRAFLCRKPLTI